MIKSRSPDRCLRATKKKQKKTKIYLFGRQCHQENIYTSDAVKCLDMRRPDKNPGLWFLRQRDREQLVTKSYNNKRATPRA